MRTNNKLRLSTEAKLGANRYWLRTTWPGSGRWYDRSSTWFAKICSYLSIVILMATSAFSAGSDDVLGSWKTDGGDSWVELFRCGEAICGTIVWLKVQNYTDSNDGPVGETKVDRKNPDPQLRYRSILGLQVIKGLTDKGTNRWGVGLAIILNPARVTNVKCTCHHLVGWNCAAISGYPFFGAPST